MALPGWLSTSPASTRLTFCLLGHLLLVAACPRHLHLLVLGGGREGSFLALHGGAFFLLPLRVPFLLLGEEAEESEKEKPSGMGAAQEQPAPLLPKGMRRALTPP